MVPTRLTHQPPPSRNGKKVVKKNLWAHGQYKSDTKTEEKVGWLVVLDLTAL